MVANPSPAMAASSRMRHHGRKPADKKTLAAARAVVHPAATRATAVPEATLGWRAKHRHRAQRRAHVGRHGSTSKTGERKKKRSTKRRRNEAEKK